jgi:hypothetical protein
MVSSRPSNLVALAERLPFKGRLANEAKTFALASPDADIRVQAFKTLVAIRDPSVVTTVQKSARNRCDSVPKETQNAQGRFEPQAPWIKRPKGGRPRSDAVE